MSSDMKAIQHSNYSDIYHLLYVNERLSKQEIADQLGLSLPTISTNLSRLIKRGLIIKNGQFESNIGRRATAYAIDPNLWLSIGIEIFRTKITICVINLRFKVLFEKTVTMAFEKSPQYYAAISNEIMAFIEENAISQPQIIGIGLGIQGLISNDGSSVLYGKILDCTGMKTSDFKEFLPFPVHFYHDADCVAVAENVIKPEDALYLSIGEHLGTAVIFNGQILNTSTGRSGTMEHITLNEASGPLCYCGRRGCIETYCSLSSLLQKNESPNTFFTALEQGNDTVTERFETYLDNMAQSIYNLHMFLDIPIVIAGDLAKHLSQKHLSALRKRLSHLSVFPEENAYLKLGHIASHAVAIGAAVPFQREQLESI